MINDREIHITEAGNRLSKDWVRVNLRWSEFVERITHPVRSSESLAEFLKFSRKKQGELKDVGGFVGGSLEGKLRRNDAVRTRSLVTLDLDTMTTGDDALVLDKLEGLGCAFAVYSTRKHTPAKPRLRVIIPLVEDVSADEYEPIARKLGEMLGMTYCDPTTFQAVRLMFWPSCSKDSEYVIRSADKPFVDGRGILGMYVDWKDVRTWPVVPGMERLNENARKKQQDPLEKEGLVGAFCRRFSISEAIETFLSDVYLPADGEDTRYTFVGGSTVGGAVVYEDKFLYSHHATDPCSQKTVNAFDLVRLHMFGALDADAEEGMTVTKLPSWQAMIKYIGETTDIPKMEFLSKQPKAAEIFSVVKVEVLDADAEGAGPEVVVAEVVEDGNDVKNTREKITELLEMSENMKPLKTYRNIMTILQLDPDVAGKIFIDTFSDKMLGRKGLPWFDEDMKSDDRTWTDGDDAALRIWMEGIWSIRGKDMIMDVLSEVARQNKENKVATRIQRTTWDGVERIETLFIDYLGCDDNIYTREASKKSLVAAAKRAIFGGGKWDYMPIIIGPQGVGKSTFLRILGLDWFNDSLTSLEGKDACEVIQGSWIIEIGELAGMRKGEVNAMKNFISREEDIYREAYGRRTKTRPRRCVFFGTANDHNFLRDETGGRRFWPIDCFENPTKKSIFKDLRGEVDQIWAEACELAKDESFSLELSREASKKALMEQEGHAEENPLAGLIADYLDKKIPENWDDLDLCMKRMHLEDYHKAEDTAKASWKYRDKVCTLEIWEECIGRDRRDMKRMNGIELTKAMSNMPGWRRIKSTSRFGVYGVQKGFFRIV